MGLSGWSPANPAAVVSAGGLGGFGRLPTLPLALFLAPIPPPPFPAGRGRDYSFLMQGAAPLASPRPSRKLHGLNLRCRCPLGGLVRLVAGRPCRYGVRRGGLGGFSHLPILPLAFFTAPYPPDPLPRRGRGGFLVFLCKGLRPLHPRGLNPWFAAKPTGSGSLRVVPGGRNSRFAATPTEDLSLWAVPAAKERGDRGRWNYPSQATAAFETVLSPGAGRTSAAGVQPPAGDSGGKVCRRPTGQVLPGT